MYAKIVDGAVARYPITGTDLVLENPQTSFPAGEFSEAMMAAYDCLPVVASEQPPYDPATQRIEEETPVLLQGAWTQVWRVVDLTPEEIAAMQAAAAEQTRQLRQAAYESEADPLFFKWQAGEGTEQAWLDKRAEIRARYP